MNIRSFFSTAVLALCSLNSWGQQVRPAESARIYHEIAGLKNLTRVLYVAAHPDDENTRLLSWLVNERHIETAYLSLTRGDGGQNILGTEQGAALGLIRTYELLEARKMDGAGQFFTRAIDFGFSKTPNETLKHWNEDSVVHDIVWVIRKFRPDVIICRFPPNAAAGHGHHSASAILAEKAFEAAGNRIKFSNQLHYVSPWQPRRILFNAYRFGNRNTISAEMMQLQVGQYNALMGMGYGELAGKSRSIHRSQGAGTPSVAGVQTEHFQLVAGDMMLHSIFDGIDTTWNRVGKPEINQQIDDILKNFNFHHPESSLPALLQLRKSINNIDDEFWRAEKLAALDRIILHATGFMAECVTQNDEVTAGSRHPFTLRLIARSGNEPVQIQSVKWPGKDSTFRMNLINDSLYEFNSLVTIPANTPVTEPYWMSVTPKDDAHYPLPADSLLGLPSTPNNLQVIVKAKIGEQEFSIPVPLSSKKLDPLKGDVVAQLRIVPTVSLALPAGLIISNPDGSLQTTIRVRSFDAIKNGSLTIVGNNMAIAEISPINLNANSDTLIPIQLSARQSAAINSKDDHFYLTASLQVNNNKYNRTRHLIQYDHLPVLQYFTPASAKVLRPNWKVSAKRIGYVVGAGDLIPDLLKQSGLTVDILGEQDFADPQRLKQYDAIVTGVRSFNTEKKMEWWMPLLLKYAEQGGTLIVQYNTPRTLVTDQLGPYPFTIDNLRTTEENATVSFIDPDHRLLQVPNRITAADFEGWVQERGLYFASQWDPRYQSLFRMNDTDEAPQEGTTLYASYGKGHYIYTPLSFFRQLPAGNSGAFRLFMNMLSVKDQSRTNRLFK